MMRRLAGRAWILGAAGLLGQVSAAIAEPVSTIDVDTVFNQPLQGGIRPVSNDECAPLACDADECCPSSVGSDGDWSPFCGELGDPWDLGDSLCSAFGKEGHDWDVAGWTQFGYQNKSDGIFNTYPNHFQAQQLYMYLEKVADGSEGFGWGGRVDVLYGTDAQNTQSFGNHPGRFDYKNGWDHGVYGWAMPQLYAELAYNDLSVKLGHFYTLFGYQVVPATGNFFYSIPFTFNFSEAFTHTGALATYQASDDVTLYGGWTLGWDTGFDQLNGGNSFLGGASVKLSDAVTATYIMTVGNLGWIGEGYDHSIVIDAVLSDKWEYVFQSDLEHTNVDPFGNSDGYNAISINQYLFYTFTDKVKAGGRAEWWKANGISYYEMTAGINFLPTANLRSRPEYRYQWSPAGNAFNGVAGPRNPAGLPLQDGIFAIDAILTF